MDVQQSEANRFVGELWSLQGTAYLVILLRYYAKISISGFRGLSWDDAFMLLATLTYTAESVAAYLVVAYWQGLANNDMTDEQRALLNPGSREYFLRQSGSKTHVAGLLLYTTLLWLLKSCWLVYYSRLINGLSQHGWKIKWGIPIIAVTYLSCLLAAFFKCVPFQKQWQINPYPGNNCTPAVSILQTVFVLVMNALTDLYLMWIPLPVVWEVRLPRKKKATLLVLFGGGFLELAFSIVRAVSILTSGFWSIRESFVSTVLTNLPVVYPLFTHLIEWNEKRQTNSADSQGYRLYHLGNIAGGNTRPPLGPGDSCEHIIPHTESYAKGQSTASCKVPKKGMPWFPLGRELAKESRGDDQIVVTTTYTVIKNETQNSIANGGPVGVNI
ncbi:hypothetical protein F4808DRAFT_467553 [Astrocystis sublimbata]|nr:hypothetical protein F4808DRAFT_467553 [Astrocystis sublimbata]